MIKLIFTIAFLLISSHCFSANLLIKVGDSLNPNGFKDGDVLCAMSDKRISLANMSQFCHVKYAGLNGDGLRITGSLLEKFMIKTSKSKMERLTPTSVLRTNLSTLEVDIINNVPNNKGEYMDVSLYIERRLRHARHKIFGTTGNEYWYSGSSITMAKLDDIWDEIELKTPARRIDFMEFPFTSKEMMRYLLLEIDDMTDTEAGQYTRVVSDEEGVLITKRKYYVDYENDLSFTPGQIADIKNKGKGFHNRPTRYIHANIVRAKP